MRWRSSCPRKIQDSVHTTRNTSPVIASTSLVFSLMGSHLTLSLAYIERWAEPDQYYQELVNAGSSLLAALPYSFNLLCSVFKLIPSISAARVLLLRVDSRVFRISIRSA